MQRLCGDIRGEYAIGLKNVLSMPQYKLLSLMSIETGRWSSGHLRTISHIFVVTARSQKLAMELLSLIMSLRIVADDQEHRDVTIGWEES